MRAMLAFGLAICGCAHGPSAEDQPLQAAGWSGPPLHVALSVTGSAAGGDAQARCAAAAAKAGAVVDANAPMQALVTMEPSGNRLQVLSLRRGLVRDEPRPAWPVERLCNDALSAVVAAVRKEQPYLEPVPTTGEGVGDQPNAQPSASGGIYHAPR